MRSIRTQLLGTLIPGVLLLSAGAGVGLYAFVEESLERSLDTALATKAQGIVSDVRAGADRLPHIDLPHTDYPIGWHREGPFYFQLWRADRSTLARFAPGSDPLPMPRWHRPFGDAVLADGTSARVAFVQFPIATGETLTLVVAHDRWYEDRPLSMLLIGLLITEVVMALGIVGIVTWSVRRGLAPVKVVSTLADQIGPDSLGIRFPGADELPPELLPIGARLNELLSRLSTAFARERRFSAAVAHELRTPLAELRSACDVALRWPDDQAAAAALKEVRDITVGMSTVVATLLTLARQQAGGNASETDALVKGASISLQDEVGSAWRKFAADAASKNLVVSSSLGDFTVIANTDLLAAVLRNLFENAIEHSPPGGRLMVATSQKDSARVELYISNTCVGLSEADLPRMFEPFWRGDAARTRGTGIAHVGLGLTLVQAYCSAMRIKVSAALVEQDQLQITLTFPSNEDESSRMRG